MVISESELAEGAYYAAEALNLDLTDPAVFVHAETAVKAAGSGLFEVSYDVGAVTRFLMALKTAATQRGVQPAALWSALDALERC